jgi:hypothetical protein
MKDFSSLETDAIAGGAGSLALLMVGIVLWRFAPSRRVPEYAGASAAVVQEGVRKISSGCS